MPVWLKNPYLNRKTTVPNLAHTFCFRFNLKENSNKYLKTLADIWCLVFGFIVSGQPNEKNKNGTEN